MNNVFNIGDFVTRKKYNNDIVFKRFDIKDDVYYLSGVTIRLLADSYSDDLVLCNDSDIDKCRYRGWRKNQAKKTKRRLYYRKDIGSALKFFSSNF